MTDEPPPSRAGLPATIETVTADYSSSTLLIDEMLADMISQGTTMVDACGALGLSKRDVYRRLATDTAFQKLLEDARNVGFEVIAANARRIIRGDETAGGTTDWKRNKAVAEFDLKLLSKWHPKAYGDKLQVESNNVTANVAISDDPVEAAKQYKEMMDRT